VGVQVKLWNPLRRRRAIGLPERFCGGVSLLRGAMSYIVCTFTFYDPPETPIVGWWGEGGRKGHGDMRGREGREWEGRGAEGGGEGKGMTYCLYRGNWRRWFGPSISAVRTITIRRRLTAVWIPFACSSTALRPFYATTVERTSNDKHRWIMILTAG